MFGNIFIGRPMFLIFFVLWILVVAVLGGVTLLLLRRAGRRCREGNNAQHYRE